MGLPVAELSEEKLLVSGAGSLLSSANGVSNITEETVEAIVEHSGAENQPTMDLKSESTEVAVSEDTTTLDEAKPMTDANGSQSDSAIEIDNTRDKNPSTEMSPVPLVSEPLANFNESHETDVLEEKPSSGLGDLGDVPLIQNLADIVEVMSVVTNDSENPPPAPEVSQTLSTDQFKDVINESVNAEPIAATNDDVMVESNKDGGAEKNDHEKILEAGSDVKQSEAAIGTTIEGSTDMNQSGPDIDSFLSGGDEKEEENGENEPEGADYEVDEAHQVLPISERRKQKRLEVFVGGLDKDTTEEDLTSVFKTVGDVVEVRLMMNPQTGKNKGYAFIRYATPALAKRAAQELERVEIRGRSCGVLPSEENDTLFLGNINKSWKKEAVLDALKNIGIENVEDITLMEDPQFEGVNRGFAFIEFNTHKEALSAFRRLQQPDAIFGSDRPAKVAWAQPLNEPDEDTMSQVKSVFVDGMPPSWDEGKVKEYFGIYGKIERIVLARNMLLAKRKDFGFVNYVDRDAALLCIGALNNTEISDGEIKMKMKVVLAKPQTKNKLVKGGTRSGYPLGFRGDHGLGVGMGVGMGNGLGNLGMGMGMERGMERGMGLRGGMGLIPYNVLSGWGNIGSNIPHFNNQIRFGNMHDYGFGLPNTQRLEKKAKRSAKRNNEVLDAKRQLLLTTKEEHATNARKKEKTIDGTKPTQEPPQNTGDSNCVISCDLGNTEPPMLHTIDIVSKPTLDKFECLICGFGFDSIDEYETHKKTKVHKVIEGFRKDQNLNNKTPLSLLHEYASRHHCEVHYETEAESNGPFEVSVVIGASVGGTTSATPIKGCGIGRNKARAKQMAAASALEKVLENISECELTKSGQSKQRFGEHERPNRKSKGGNNGGVNSGTIVGGNRNSRGRSNNDLKFVQSSSNSSIVGLSNIGGGTRGGSGKNKRNYNSNDFFLANRRNPNTIPLNGYNDFITAQRRNNFIERLNNRGIGGFNAHFQDSHGRITTHNPKTCIEYYDRIQGGRGYGSPDFGGRDFVASGNRIGSSNFNSQDLTKTIFANRELPPPPPLLNLNGRDLPPIGLIGANRDYETSGLKRPFISMDEETRFTDAHRALPRPRFEALEQASIHSNSNAQGFGIQSFFSEAPRSSGPRLQEQTQFNPYVQSQHQGLPVGHNIVQSSHVPNQLENIPIAMVGVPTLTNAQNGSPYSIYDAVSQPNTSLSTSGYANMNQDYMVNTPLLAEMSQGNSYQTQSSCGVPYGIMPQTISSQVVGNFASIQNCVQQQPFY